LIVPAVASIDYIFWSDLLWGSTMQPVGAVVAVVALVWCLGRTRSLKEFAARADSKPAVALYWWMRYALPAGILAGLLYGWLG
jgi:SNF family Na+-dependent transporter